MSLYVVSYNTIYIFMYNRDICFHYTLSYIITNKYCHYTSSRIHESVFVIIRDDV